MGRGTFEIRKENEQELLLIKENTAFKGVVSTVYPPYSPSANEAMEEICGRLIIIKVLAGTLSPGQLRVAAKWYYNTHLKNS